MSALPIIITTAGLNALPNAQNTGVSNVVIASLGVSPTQIAATAATNVIPGEVKRIAGVSGQVVADDQIYVSAADQTEDTYVVRTIGLYLDTGVLFAVYSQAAPLLEKAGPAMAVLEAAIKLSSPQANAIEFSGGGWLNPQASETVQGVLRLATEAEARAGTNTTRAVTPKGLKAAIDDFGGWVQGQITSIYQALAGKAAVGHTHVMANIDGLVAALNAKAAAAHTHVMGDITGLVDALNGKAASIHTHAMSSIDGLTQALAGKAAAAHTHVMGEINGLTEALAGKAAAAHTHVMSEITGLVAALNAKASLGAAVRFDRVFFGLANALVYADGDRLIFRAGAAGAERYFGCNTDGSFEVYNGIIKSTNGPVWDPGNFTPSTKATLGDSVTFADVRAFRGNGTGVVYLGDLLHYLFFDGANYNLPAAPLIVNGGVVWTSATFNPATKVNKAGDVLTGPLTMPEVRLKAAGTGSGSTYAALISKYYGDDNYGVGFVGWKGASGYSEVGSIDHLGRAWFNGFRVWTAENLNPASQADAAAGVAADRFITPAALWSFARNLGSPGYAVIPGTGLLLQWGISVGSIPEGETHAVLPVAFGGGCLIALANPRNPGRNINSDFYMQVVGHFADRIAFFANRANGSAGNVDGFEWIALGRVSGGTPDPAYSSGGTGGGGGGGGGGQIEV
ncbi:hypothetical protein [Brevundimonas sp. SPF441]|uniref:gp53-like domain-containing protein n=1 Tax=Brevundimonas sp. SPF441 TaxID=2663795 RepID=UPI00129EA00B|nr:hypothetical protein [Brevundimonas sp. SPF441]MRL67881.1 hypothetical protein [Brevundimonas sp. SPF441]